MDKDGGVLKQDSPWGRRPSHTDQNEKIQKIFRKKGSGPLFSGQNKLIIWGLLILVLGGWLISGFYQINPDEQGIVLRFGKWIKTTEAGWHYHLPYPVEQVLKPKVTMTNQITIGFGNPDESLMLTGDRNIVDLSVIVQWHIKDPEEFLFNIRNPQQTIKAATESAIREIIGQTPIDSTFAEGRAEIQEQARQDVQKILNSYKAGINVTEVNLKDVNPPLSVIESFREVDRAYSDQERMLNEAETYRNDVVPKARGEAAHIVEDANGYKASAIAQAQGGTAHFKALLKEHAKNPTLMERRLYYETMERALKDANKVIVDAKGAHGVLPHMQLPAVISTDK